MDDRKVGELDLKTSFYQRKVGGRDRDIIVSVLNSEPNTVVSSRYSTPLYSL